MKKVHTAILSVESESDFNLILELSKKLNFHTKILKNTDIETNVNIEINSFQFANESSLSEWLTIEEDEAWKNL